MASRKKIQKQLLIALVFLYNISCIRENQHDISQNSSKEDSNLTIYDILDAPANRKILFYPRKTQSAPVPPARDFMIPSYDGIKIHARFHLFNPVFPTILLFHGNGETVSDYDDLARVYSQAGINLFAAEYREYGFSEGTAGVFNMEKDALSVADFFTSLMKKNYPKSQLFIMGRSLGGASAVRIAAEKGSGFKGLILESTFSDAVPVLEFLRVKMGSKKDEIRSYFSAPSYLAKTHLPVLILHGTADSLIPVSHAKANYEFLVQSRGIHPNAELVLLNEAAHNNTMFHPDYFIKLMGFVK
jgi:alpha-beta hydrolase superfamily lysophospholipase